MEIQDTAFFLSCRRFGETGSIAAVFGEQHGLMRGLVHGASGKRLRGMLQAGNRLDVHWRARLNHQLGHLTLELLEAHAAYLLPDMRYLSVLNAACALLESYLVEREPHPQLHALFARLIRTMAQGGDNKSSEREWLTLYIRLELQLLADAGFGLDWEACALTGVAGPLTHVSPKSGRAVCAQAAAPYLDKLLPLPAFLREDTVDETVGWPEQAEGLRLTGHFLHHWLAEAAERPVPPARARLLGMLA